MYGVIEDLREAGSKILVCGEKRGGNRHTPQTKSIQRDFTSLEAGVTGDTTAQENNYSSATKHLVVSDGAIC